MNQHTYNSVSSPCMLLSMQKSNNISVKFRTGGDQFKHFLWCFSVFFSYFVVVVVVLHLLRCIHSVPKTNFKFSNCAEVCTRYILLLHRLGITCWQQAQTITQFTCMSKKWKKFDIFVFSFFLSFIWQKKTLFNAPKTAIPSFM